MQNATNDQHIDVMFNAFREVVNAGKASGTVRYGGLRIVVTRTCYNPIQQSDFWAVRVKDASGKILNRALFDKFDL